MHSNHNSSSPWRIQIQLGHFSKIFTVSLIALLLSPQTLFWYVHLILLLLSLCSPRFFQAFNNFLECLQHLLHLVPVRNIAVNATIIHTAVIELPELQIHDQPSSDDHGIGGGENLHAHEEF
ncbi:hypothetical protein FNV43_RR08930 [Rhamnella rubrinervis]|uniref:Uncharacterized protein n=1 Tax=Rhamnella rubrinervis TaxID=2594499 RepID=A0A8K0H936_9ROSA|nr:hypothetical protein FNV43_RR08930 [Rhamnella rubrinervis]